MIDIDERLAALLGRLGTEEWTPAEVLAGALGVSKKTVYRDVIRLHRAGVPLWAAPGRGYKLPAGYRLAPMTLTEDEAALLQVLSERAEHMGDARIATAARAVRQKIAHALPAEAHHNAAALRERMALMPSNVFDAPTERKGLAHLREAVAGEREIETCVRGKNLILHPYALTLQHGTWVVVAAEPATGLISVFPAAGLKEIRPTGATFSRPASYDRTVPDSEPRDVTVEVRFSDTVAPWIEQRFHPFLESLDRRPDGLYGTFRIHRDAELMPWLLAWGHHAEVLQPSSLRRRLRAELQRMLDAYRADAAELF